ncbi:peptidoglycan editing factor PgeF [Cellulomonas sp. DKR-3]|uniref:Purine nucleoside phosphorylase n=1 Tax=Cellulomonas fulva TaxID=2835530 RepID=A0ABS5U358_9CELL|nr:peptidoglycan editing factor PgeF [Cellulomonas fulva]MBT0995837.1 peptidoglycan editing factor PgeF [Cellulomonas fulva]
MSDGPSARRSTDRRPGGLTLDEVDLGPGVRAGFTDRRGGVSRPPYDALDLGAHVGDDEAAVRENRARLAAWAGCPVAFADQVHGATTLVVATPSAVPADALRAVGAGDALVTADPGVALAVLVADCVPVLLADDDAGVVGAAHAGRRGLVDGVLPSVVEAMVALGARPERVRAAVGPAIAGSSYEVPEAMRDEVAVLVPEARATTRAGTPALDLPRGAEAVLLRCGVGEVLRSRRDTWADADLFSFRRDGRTGRAAGVIRPLARRVAT